jgi:uncharacterized protein
VLNLEVKKYIDNSVLCWLATVDAGNMPNVSPKETFTYYGDDLLLIGNIASPNSLRNTRHNRNVCVSFVDIFVQKGYKLKGVASVIGPGEPLFEEYLKPLTDLIGTAFPVSAIWAIKITSAEPVMAPSYFLVPGTSEEGQIKSALENYTSKLP